MLWCSLVFGMTDCEAPVSTGVVTRQWHHSAAKIRLQRNSSLAATTCKLYKIRNPSRVKALKIIDVATARPQLLSCSMQVQTILLKFSDSVSSWQLNSDVEGCEAVLGLKGNVSTANACDGANMLTLSRVSNIITVHLHTAMDVSTKLLWKGSQCWSSVLLFAHANV